MIRSFDTALEMRAEGREVYGMIFPLNTRTHIRELDDAGNLDEYDEMFLPRCTERMRQSAERRGGSPAWITFTVDHERGFDARLGFCTLLEETSDGAFGTFKLYDGPQLPKIRSMLAESHKGLSVEFSDVAPPIIKGSLRQRRQVNVSHVTATPTPAYADAGILAMRSQTVLTMGTETPNLDIAQALLAELRPPVPIA